MVMNILLYISLFCGIAVSQGFVDIGQIAEQYEKLNQESLNWGPYRSNLYLGLRPKIPESLIAGLLWFPTETFHGVSLAKHACDQSHNIKKFGWTKYDPRYGGLERIIDGDSGLELSVKFVKTEDGLNWALRIEGTTNNPHSVHSVVFYTGLESDGDIERISDPVPGTDNLVDGDLIIKGKMDKIGGEFDIQIIDDVKNVMPKSNTLDYDPSFNPSLTHHVSLTVPYEEVWKASDIFWTLLRLNVEEIEELEKRPYEFSPIELFQLRNPGGFQGNLHFVEKTFIGNFQYDIIFNTKSSANKIQSEHLDQMITKTLNRIDEKFTRKFQLNAPFNTDKYVDFAKEILSQLMGGIIYQYGDQLVDRKAIVDDVNFSHAQLNGEKEGPYELFTCVPSRPFFPRGFYWDEGFHLLPVLDYDSDLTLEIVKSWFSLIDDNGWIAREQILGDEARTKVPMEFTIQNPNIANPPTLMLIFTELLDMANKLNLERLTTQNDIESNLYSYSKMKDSLGDLHLENPELMIDYAHSIYEKLQRHYEWFRRTQRGNTDDIERSYPHNEEVYRWKGRTKDHCLPSGIDDYPRCIADIGELNVDLISWMGAMTRAMHQIAQLLGKQDDAKLYKQRYDFIVENIDSVHWSEEDQMYCDVSVDDDDLDVFECHEGYVTLMPFVHRLIPSSSTSKLLATLRSLSDPAKLWSQFGIRSLSKQDSNFHKGEDYWRGHIWININYLVLESLFDYGSRADVDPAVRAEISDVYKKMRENVVSNIFEEYQRTGYAWEQYNEEDGHGQRTRHFLGWTSLVILMMKMPTEIL